MSPRCHFLCLFLLLAAGLDRAPATGTTSDRPAPRSFAYVDGVYPFSFRNRARLLEGIAAVRTVAADVPNAALLPAFEPAPTVREAVTFPTGNCRIYVLMSLQR
jgi:hypothetical protein